MTLGALVGLTAEARLLRAACPDMPIAVSGATLSGARRAMSALLRAGVREVLSFGCAGGLSCDVAPGAVVVPEWVSVGGVRHAADDRLRARFGSGLPGVFGGGLLHSDVLVATAAEKARLAAQSACLAVDMESGLVAESGLPFVILRVVCDDAGRDLPPVAASVIEDGGISAVRLVRGLWARPGQIGALIAMGREAAIAQRAMKRHLVALRP